MCQLIQGNRPRLVNLFGYELDIVPNGIMFLLKTSISLVLLERLVQSWVIQN